MKKYFLFLLILFGLLLKNQDSHAQCTSCSFTAVNGGNYSLANGYRLCINSNISSGITLNFDGIENSICVGKGVTWKQEKGGNLGGVTIDVQGTFILNGSYTINGPVIINVKPGGIFQTNSTGFGNNVTINNYGKVTFTTDTPITNQGTFTLNNFLGGTFDAPNTPLFLMAPGTSLINLGNLFVSNLENQNGNIQNMGTITVGRNFSNHGNFINNSNSMVQVTCATGNGTCGLTIGNAEQGKKFTNNGCMSIHGHVRFAGPGIINGQIEVLDAYNLTLDAVVSGSGGQLLVNNGTSTISPNGQYTGKNMKFCDHSSKTGNEFDVNAGTNPSTYTIDCNAITCDGAARALSADLPCSLTLTASAGACNPTTNQYGVTGTVSLTNNSSAGSTLLLTDGLNTTTLTVPTNTSIVSYTLAGLSSNAGSHTLTASVRGCTTTSKSYMAPVACGCDPLVVTTIRSASAICAGQPVTFVGQVRAVGSYTYAWTGPGTITNANTATATVSGLSTGTYTYTLTVSSRPGCSSSVITSITVNALPTSTVSNATTCQGISTTLTATGGVDYRFFDGITTSSNPTGQFILVPNPAAPYSMTVTDANRCEVKTMFSLAASPNTPCGSDYVVEKLSKLINIYPNPSTNGIITIESVTDLVDVDIIVLTPNGQELLHTSVPLLTDHKLIDLSGMATGLYVVRVRATNADVTKRLVINR